MTALQRALDGVRNHRRYQGAFAVAAIVVGGVAVAAALRGSVWHFVLFAFVSALMTAAAARSGRACQAARRRVRNEVWATGMGPCCRLIQYSGSAHGADCLDSLDRQ